MKVCRSCKRRLDESSFNRRTASPDGLRTECRECQRRAAQSPASKASKRRWSKKNRERELKAKREWNRKHWMDRDQAHLNALKYAWRKRHPEIQRAHNAVHHAVKTGRLTRPSTCERCAKPCKPHGHHPDYTKPLDVQWLCPTCHLKEHMTDTMDFDAPVEIKRDFFGPDEHLFVCGELSFSDAMVKEKIERYALNLELPIIPTYTPGTLQMFHIMRGLQAALELRYEKTGEEAVADLSMQLLGLEGKRVEIIEDDGAVRTFFVGKTIEAIPHHMELASLDDAEGPACKLEYQRVKEISG